MGSGTWPGEYGSQAEAGPDGRIVVLARGAVWQVGTDGRASVLARGKPAANGLDPISGVAPLAAGDTLVADATSNQIVRLASAGSRTVVAGTGPAGLSGDGGLAVAATIGPLGRIAAFADGSFLLAQRDAGEAWPVRRVDPAGVIATAAGGGPSAADDHCRSDSVPRRQCGSARSTTSSPFRPGTSCSSTAGQLTQIVCASPGPAERRYDTNLDGRRADEAILDDPTSVAVTNDRTLLIGAGSPDVEDHRDRAARPDGAAPAPPDPARRRRVLVAARTSDARVAADRLRTIVPGPLGLGVAIARRLIFRQLDRQAKTQRWTTRRTSDGVIRTTVSGEGSLVIQP
jgi:hypothetical protein